MTLRTHAHVGGAGEGEGGPKVLYPCPDRAFLPLAAKGPIDHPDPSAFGRREDVLLPRQQVRFGHRDDVAVAANGTSEEPARGVRLERVQAEMDGKNPAHARLRDAGALSGARDVALRERPNAVNLADPADLHRTLAQRFNAGDLEGLLALYEEGATLVREPGVPVSGAKDLREALAGFLSFSPKQTFVATLGVERSGDLALTRSRWGFHGTNRSDGSSIVIEHFGVEVMRHQPDGSWRFVIDDPFGGDGAAAPK